MKSEEFGEIKTDYTKIILVGIVTIICVMFAFTYGSNMNNNEMIGLLRTENTILKQSNVNLENFIKTTQASLVKSKLSPEYLSFFDQLGWGISDIKKQQGLMQSDSTK